MRNTTKGYAAGWVMAQVRIIDDATERLRKRQQDEARATSAQQRSAANGAAAQLRAQVCIGPLCKADNCTMLGLQEALIFQI